MGEIIKVIVVEDIADDAELMIFHLEEEGYICDWKRVETESEYVTALLDQPDLILCDWSLPSFSGTSAMELARIHTPNTPFIIVSGVICTEEAISAIHQGAYDYLLKDRLVRLGKAVRNAFEERKLEAEKVQANAELAKANKNLRKMNKQLINQNKKIAYMVYHDPLTGLHNRKSFQEELCRLDTKENLPVSILLGDINGLKLINDSFGLSEGDEIIKKTSEIISKICSKSNDLVARVGGGEFAIALTKTDSMMAAKIIGRLNELIDEIKTGNINVSISFGHYTKEEEAQSILDILSIAENHMYRHKLYESSSSRSKSIEIIINTLFEKSKRESLHSQRVSIICQAIASKMNLDKQEIEQIKLAALMHDIGKIGVDEKILNKIGGLDTYERAEIEKHPTTGWRILSSVNEFSEIATYILDHHEKWNGDGYPRGLKGDKIPLFARIITVADSYDAMTSERTYKKSISKEDAIAELKRCAGTHFDPMVVDVFVNQVLSNEKNDFTAFEKS